MESAEERYQEIKSAMNSESNENLIHMLKALLRDYPDFGTAHEELGTLYYQIQDHENALEHYEKAARLEPDNPRLQKSLGDFYYTVLSRTEDAVAQYRKALDLNPLNSEIMFLAANLLVSLHRFEEAEDLYQQLITIEPWRLDVQEYIDRIKDRKQEKDPKTSDTLYQRAQILAQNSDIDGAIKILQGILMENPDFALAHNDLGVLKYQKGDTQNAQRHYEKAVALDPGNMIYRKNLAEFYLLVQGEVEKALEIYVTILKDHPYDIETLMIAGKCCAEFKQLEKAKFFYEVVLDIEPWNLEATERLAELEQGGIQV